MPYRTSPGRQDRAKAIAAVVLVHAGIAALLLSGSGDTPADKRTPPTVLIDIAPPPPEPEVHKAPDEQGAAGKKASPTPVVAPPAKLPAPSPLPAAPVAGSGSAASSGSAAGTGSGAGGSGSGSGGGGGGTPAAWLSGGLRDSDYPREGLRERIGGTVGVRFTVLPSGRIADCRAVRSSGSALLDGLTCRLLTERLRFRPATDGAGRPVASVLGSDYTWGVRTRR